MMGMCQIYSHCDGDCESPSKDLDAIDLIPPKLPYSASSCRLNDCMLVVGSCLCALGDERVWQGREKWGVAGKSGLKLRVAVAYSSSTCKHRS